MDTNRSTHRLQCASTLVRAGSQLPRSHTATSSRSAKMVVADALAGVNWAHLALAVALPLSGGIGGSIATASQIKTWYAGIRKPSWTPPNWLFGPVWTALYTMMGVASYLVWRQGGVEAQALPLAVYALQLALNFAWTPLFFSAHALGAATADILAMWVAIAATIALFGRVIGAPLALGLLGPYLLWVSYASALTIWIWRFNPRQAAKPKAS